jgi:hypothetical protein
MSPIVLLSDKDNVGVAIRDLAPGTQVPFAGGEVVARDSVPLGHKIALRRIEPGQKIVKFGVNVGSATTTIEPGAHVHMHNVKSDYLNNAVDHWE